MNPSKRVRRAPVSCFQCIDMDLCLNGFKNASVHEVVKDATAWCIYTISLPKFVFDTFSLNSPTHYPCKLIQYNRGMHFSNEGRVHKAWHSRLYSSSAKRGYRGLLKRHWGFVFCGKTIYWTIYSIFIRNTSWTPANMLLPNLYWLLYF